MTCSALFSCRHSREGGNPVISEILNHNFLFIAVLLMDSHLRGNDSKEIFQIVENPVEAAQAFQNELISENIPYQIEFESMNKIKINIPVNEKTLLIASSRRIELPQEKQSILVFEKSK